MVAARASLAEPSARARLAQPARFAAAPGPQLSPDVEAPLNSREQILGTIRTALGHVPGESSAPPPVRLHVPVTDLESRIAGMLERVQALAGKTHLANSAED